MAGISTHRAAFVDLDRALLRRASGPVLHAALEAAGLARSLRGNGLLFVLYDRFGENVPVMALARAAAVAARGWAEEDVREAGRKAVPGLVDLVAPYAPGGGVAPRRSRACGARGTVRTGGWRWRWSPRPWPGPVPRQEGASRGAGPRGEVVMVLPQGTIPRGRDFFDPVLRGKTGVARPPTVRVRAGAPIVLGLGAPKADTPVVMAATSALLPREGRARRQPSAGELARTYPPGRGLP